MGWVHLKGWTSFFFFFAEEERGRAQKGLSGAGLVGGGLWENILGHHLNWAFEDQPLHHLNWVLKKIKGFDNLMIDR